jgi:hypothetical protein
MAGRRMRPRRLLDRLVWWASALRDAWARQPYEV